MDNYTAITLSNSATKTYDIAPSSATSVYSTLAALAAIQTHLPSGGTWEGNDPLQQQFISSYLAALGEAENISELLALASYDHRLLNDFMRRMHFRSQPFTPFENPDHIGAASILRLGLRWTKPGISTQIRCRDGISRKGVELPRDQVTLYRVTGHHNLVIQVATTDPETAVNFTELDLIRSPSSGPFELIEIATGLSNRGRIILPNEFAHVQFPMVNLSTRPDSHWLAGLRSMNGSMLQAEIVAAQQLLEVKVNHYGASVRDEMKVEAITTQISFRSALEIN